MGIMEYSVSGDYGVLRVWGSWSTQCVGIMEYSVSGDDAKTKCQNNDLHWLT